jgi:predicted aspartyl protease
MTMRAWIAAGATSVLVVLCTRCVTPAPHAASTVSASTVSASTVSDAPPLEPPPLETYALGPILDDSEPPADDEGYDGSRIIATSAIEGVSWLPLLDGGRKGVPFVNVVAKGGVTFAALLDTGAQISLMPRAIVDDIGAVPVLDDKGEPLVRGMVDALGGTSFASIMTLPSVTLGAFELVDVRVAVPLADNDAAGTWPVIGFPELARMDILLAADSGVVGLFAAGTAPPLENARTARVAIEDSAPFVVARTRDGRDVRMVLDTGASSTTLPRALGLVAVEGLGENVRVLGGRASVGRAYAPPIWLGAGSNASPVALALRAVDLTSSGTGLLGGDALMEHRALLSAQRGTLALAPARWGSARRMKWRGKSCKGGSACIDARLIRCPPSRGALDQTCVEVAVDPSIDVALAIDVRLFDEQGALRPRAMTVVFPAGSARTDGLALAALPAHPTRVAIRVRRPSPFELDCRAGRVCWWN